MHARQRVTRSSFTHPLLRIVTPQPLSALPERSWSVGDARARLRVREYGREVGRCRRGAVLFPHRSWTGFCSYEVTFVPDIDGSRRIVGDVVERSPQRYKQADDEYDRVFLDLVLSSYLRGESVPGLRTRFQEVSSR
jgi:hypothetical protein